MARQKTYQGCLIKLGRCLSARAFGQASALTSGRNAIYPYQISRARYPQNPPHGLRYLAATPAE